MNIFSALTSKLFAGLAVLLLGALIVTSVKLSNRNATIADQVTIIEKGRTDLAECNAARAVQNAAITRLGAEGDRQRAAFSAAVTSGNAAILAARARVVTVRSTVRNGCPTPASIRGAGL